MRRRSPSRASRLSKASEEDEAADEESCQLAPRVTELLWMLRKSKKTKSTWIVGLAGRRSPEGRHRSSDQLVL